MKFNMFYAVNELILHPNEAAKSVLVYGGASSKWDKTTLRKNWVITVFVDIFHCFGKFICVLFGFLFFIIIIFF
jgi:hypothetical protein